MSKKSKFPTRGYPTRDFYDFLATQECKGGTATVLHNGKEIEVNERQLAKIYRAIDTDTEDDVIWQEVLTIESERKEN